MTIQVIYVLNDNVLEVDGLINKQTSTYINSATVTATLKDSSGTNVTGETWPITLAYVSASNGKYRATLKDTLSLSAGQSYTAHIDADGGADLKGHWEIPIQAQTRT